MRLYIRHRSTDKDGLSTREQDTLRELSRLSSLMGYPPSIKELSVAIGNASASSTFRFLEALELRGFIKRSRFTQRSITITDKGKTWLATISSS